MLSILSSCGPDTLKSEQVDAIEAYNSHIHVSFTGMEKGEWNGEEGFFVYIEAKSLLDYKTDDFSYTLQRTLYDEQSRSYETKHSEILSTDINNQPLEDRTVLIKQFFSPSPPKDIDTLDIHVFVRPDYYTRSILFSNLKDGDTNIMNNDFYINDVKINKKTLAFRAHDVHEIKGLDVSLIQDKEQIYPFFRSTDYNEETNELYATYEFAQALPEAITLQITRLRLQENIWEFPLTIPVNLK